MKLLHKLLSVSDAQFKAVGPEGAFEGWASTYGNVDSYRDTIMPGAYSDTLKNGRRVKMFYNHVARRNDMPANIGTWEFEERDGGLWAKGQLLMEHPLVKNIWPSLSAGQLDGLSIGYMVPEGGSVLNTQGIRELHKIDLYEVSIVDEPADSYARVSLDSIKSLHTVRDVEDCLRDAGFSATEAKAFISHVKGILAGETTPRNADDEVLSALQSIYGK